MTRRKNIAQQIVVSSNAIFGFLASLKLAVVVIVALMISLAAGTLLESYYNAHVARTLIYNTRWFSAILIILAINLAAAAFDRLPWKKKHTGFVLTHLGIIMILAGSLITQKYMIDGQITLAEGETEKQITVASPMLYVYSEKTHNEKAFEIQSKAFAWKGKETIHRAKDASGLPEIHLLTYYPQARAEERMVEGPEGAPALQIQVTSSLFNDSFWLIEDDANQSSQVLGPATISFSKQKLEALQPGQNATGYLDLVTKEATYHLTLPEKITTPLKLQVPGKNIEVEVVEYFKNAFVNENKLGETPVPEGVSGEVPAMNPALRLVVRSEGKEEKHIVFAKFPDFQSMHGKTENPLEIRLYYHVPDTGSKSGSEIRLIRSTEGIQYQIKSDGQIKDGSIPVGGTIEPGWMDFKFTVKESLAHASRVYDFLPVQAKGEMEGVFAAIQIEVGSGSEVQTLWLGQGMQENLALSAGQFGFLFGDKKIPAGFRLALKEFKMETYPGTENPMSYESDVVLTDPMRGMVKETTISMNEPLSYNGYKIYQSGYNVSGNGPKVSVFSVAKDPGIFLKYSGTIVMVLGIILIYFFRNYSRTAGQL